MLPVLKNASKESLDSLAEELSVRRTKHFVLLFSMGSQFDHLIVQQLARLGVYCLVADPSSVSAQDVQKISPSGIIISGGPASVHAEPPPFDNSIFDLGIPTLGICLGFQMWAAHAGARVVPGEKREFGVHRLSFEKESELFRNIPPGTRVLQSHGDKITPGGALEIIGSTDNAPVAAGRAKHLWGVQFHPEVSDTEHGEALFDNFCSLCGITDRFPARSTAEEKVSTLRKTLAGKKVLIALSGGSDSSVIAYLIKAAGTAASVRGVYIRGIDRPDDEAFVQKFFGSEPWLDVRIVDGTEDFLDVLKGKTGMREKRMAMRGVYKDILEKECREFGADFLAQGTLYTDLRESGLGNATGARVAEIKVHHNTNLNFSTPEISPLETEVKDSARSIGREVGVPEELLIRHPFPGPGLVVRIEGEVTPETLRIARAVDGIYIEELRKMNLYNSVWQAGAVVTNSRTTCTKGDDAAEGRVIALWAVWSVNGFTARFAQLPYEFLDAVSRRITNEVREAGAVVYRVSDKPPTTIEWG